MTASENWSFYVAGFWTAIFKLRLRTKETWPCLHIIKCYLCRTVVCVPMYYPHAYVHKTTNRISRPESLTRPDAYNFCLCVLGTMDDELALDGCYQPEWPDWASFRPLGDSLYTLGSFMKITKVDHILGLLFTPFKCHILILTKWVGLHFGRFFANSSGHPVTNAPSQPYKTLKRRLRWYDRWNRFYRRTFFV
jgi:hypothetical protein